MIGTPTSALIVGLGFLFFLLVVLPVCIRLRYRDLDRERR